MRNPRKILKTLIVGAIIVAVIAPWHLNIATKEVVVEPPIKNGGYPAIWADAPLSKFTDSWGYSSRTCGSYVAYKAYEKFGIDISGWTDAKDWELQAIHRGFVVDEIPSPNSVAIMSTFPPGHVAWVEKAKNDGSGYWTISQYNEKGKGEYSEANMYPRFVKFIHFDKNYKT